MKETEILRGLHKARSGLRAGGKYAGGFVPSQEAVDQFSRGAGSMRRISQGDQPAKDLPFAVMDAGVGALRQPLSAMYNGAKSAITRTPQPAAPVANPADIAPPVLAPALDGLRKRQQELQNLSRGTAFLEGPGTGTSDDVPVNLSRGEAVLPAKTVRKLGPENIARIIQDTNDGKPPKGLRAGGSYNQGMLEKAVGGLSADDLDMKKVQPAANMPPKPVAAPVTPAPKAVATGGAGRTAMGGVAEQLTSRAAATPVMDSVTRGLGGNPAAATTNVIGTNVKPGMAIPEAPAQAAAKSTAQAATQAAPKAATTWTGKAREGLSALNKVGIDQPGVPKKPGFVKGFLTPGALATAGITSAFDTGFTDTEEFERRFGKEGNTTGFAYDTSKNIGLGENEAQLVSDLATRGLGAAQNFGNAATFGLLDRAANAIGSKLSGNGWDFGHTSGYETPGQQPQAAQPKPAPAPVTQPQATQPSATQPQAPAPHPQAAGPHPDLNAQLATAPKDLSSVAGLQRGAIYKTTGVSGNPMYSGMDVGANAQFVDGQGNSIKTRGSVGNGIVGEGSNVVDGNAGLRAAQSYSGPSGGADVSAALQAAAARGDTDALKAYYQRDGGTWMGNTAAQDAQAGASGDAAKARQLLMGDIQRGLDGGKRLTRAGMAALQGVATNEASREASRNTLSSAQARHSTPSGDALLNAQVQAETSRATASAAQAKAAREELTQGNEALNKRLQIDPAAQGATPEESKQRHAELVDHLARTNRTVTIGSGENKRNVDMATAFRLDPRAAEQAVAEESGTLSLSKLAKSKGENMFFKNVPNAGEIELAEPMGDVNLTDYKNGMKVSSMAWEKAFGSGVVRIKGANDKIVSIPLSSITEDSNSAAIFQALAAANARFKSSQAK